MSSPAPQLSPAPRQRPTLRVGVVGAGRVGAVLGAALRSAGHEVVGVSAVSDASRDRAEVLLPGVPVLTVPEVVRSAQLVLLAVPDDALTDLVAGLHATDTWVTGQLVAHTSGRHGLTPFAPVADRLLPMAIHPAMTFTGTSLDLARLAECCFGITTPEALRPVAEALVVEMGGEPVWVPEEARGREGHGRRFGHDLRGDEGDALRRPDREAEQRRRPVVADGAEAAGLFPRLLPALFAMGGIIGHGLAPGGEMARRV